MSAALPAPDFAPLDENTCTQQIALLNALHCAHPILVDGKEQFVQVLHARQAGGRIEMEMWVMGCPDPVDLALVKTTNKT